MEVRWREEVGDKMKGDDGRGEGGMVTLPFTQVSRHFTNHVISHMSSHMSSHMISHMISTTHPRWTRSSSGERQSCVRGHSLMRPRDAEHSSRVCHMR